MTGCATALFQGVLKVLNLRPLLLEVVRVDAIVTWEWQDTMEITAIIYCKEIREK